MISSALSRIVCTVSLVALAVGISACASLESRSQALDEERSAALLGLLAAEPQRFGDILERADEYRLKIELAVVRPVEGGAPTLERYALDRGPEYFYPASSVKTCAAIAAAEHMAMLEQSAPAAGIDAPLRFHPLFPGESIEEVDPSHVANGRITLAHDMRKVFLVSDNAAYNRLYEFAGNEAVNRSMRRAGLGSTRILHRLSEFRSPEDQLRTPKIEVLEGGRVIATVPERTSSFTETNDDLSGTSIGVGRLAGGEVVDGPMSFVRKNYVHLRDLQDMHIMLLRPDIAIPGRAAGSGFGLRDDVRASMAEAMAGTPGASRDPIYAREDYPDDYSKFLGPGVWKVVPKEEVVIRDKVGRAYGFSTTNSEVIDTRTGASYFLAATIYINPNGVLNDGIYGYERADQFFADLGEVVSRFAL
ncbi:MAG: serine hydrolase [Planctomycetota bacterium]